MTYKDLANIIKDMPEDFQEKDVTIYNKSEMEFYPVLNAIQIAIDLDTLDDGQPYLTILT